MTLAVLGVREAAALWHCPALVQTRLSYYASSETARAIIGQPPSTIDLRETIR